MKGLFASGSKKGLVSFNRKILKASGLVSLSTRRIERGRETYKRKEKRIICEQSKGRDGRVNRGGVGGEREMRSRG